MKKSKAFRRTGLALAAVMLLGVLVHGTAFADTTIPVTGITLNTTSLLLVPTQPTQLTPTVEPADATDRLVVWSSDNPAVATVSEEGEVMALAEGETIIRASAADGSIHAECAVTVTNSKIASLKYRIADGMISNVAKFTAVDKFQANLYNGSAVRVYRGETEVTSGNVATGMAAVLMVEGSESDRLAIIVNGDVNGDGLITISDYTLTRYDILSLQPLNGVFHSAADVNGDGTVSITDYTQLRYDILGLKQINDDYSPDLPDLPDVSDPRIQTFLAIALAQLGDPYVLGNEGPDSFDCSGLAYYCLRESGYSGTLWRTNADTYSKWSDWLYVASADIQPGDLLFFKSDSNPNRIGHVGIYLGNNYLVHASSSNGCVIISRMSGWYIRQLSHARRVYT